MIEIIPKISAGPFVFNTSVDLYLNKYVPENIIRDQSCDEASYEYMNGRLNLYAQSGNVYFIIINFDCLLHDVNIYNMNINDFFEKFDIPDSERIVDDTLWVTDNEQQEVYEIVSLGLQIWVNEFNMIVTIIASDN